MKIDVKEVRVEDAFGRRIAVEVAAEELGARLEAAIADLKRGLALPGFRKGKVPRSVVESRFGPGVRSEVVRQLVEEAVWEAVREAALDPIAEPRIENIDHGNGRPLSFTARVEVRPAVDPIDLTGLRVDKVVYPITDEEVEGILANLQQSWAKIEQADRPAARGDVITVDLAELGEGRVPLIGHPLREGIHLELSDDLLPREFIEALVGRRTGESVTVEVPPPREGELSPPGAPRYHQVALKRVEAKTVPPLDDAFAERVTGGKLKTLAELTAQIRANLEADEERRARRVLERDLVDRLAGGIRFEIPERIIRPLADRMFTRAIEGLPELKAEERERLRERLAVESRQAAAAQIRRELVIGAVAHGEGIEISDEEAEAELRLAERHAKREGEPAEGGEGVGRAGRLERVRDALVERKVLKFLVDKADVQVVQAPTKQKRIVTPYDA